MSDDPIIPGFHPDPSICRAGDRYYVVNSTFEYLPGIPIHASDDLREWTPVGHVLTRHEQLDLSAAPSNAGIYAPTIRHRDGRFYLTTSDLQTVAGGQMIFHAEDPAGEWSVPVRVPGTIGIDPDLFWDEDGGCHLSWKGMADDGQRGILSVPVDPLTGERLGPVRPLWQGIDGLASPEGPHLYRRDGWYYCLLAQGGTERGHCVVIARAETLDGPWEPAPANPILSHRSTVSPVQNTGHADLIETADGGWAAVYLGVRPRGMTPKFHVNGRETFLAGIDWVDGWPVFDEQRYPAAPVDTAFDEDFSGPALDHRWTSHGGAHLDAVTREDGGLRISPVSGRLSRPALAVRARDEAWRAEARWRGDGVGALRVHLDTENWIELRVEADRAVVTQAIAGRRYDVEAVERARGDEVAVAVASEPWPADWPANQGPDAVSLSLVGDGGDQLVARIDGRLLSTEVTAGFTGRMIGVRAVEGEVVLRRLSYAPRVLTDEERAQPPA